MRVTFLAWSVRISPEYRTRAFRYTLTLLLPPWYLFFFRIPNRCFRYNIIHINHDFEQNISLQQNRCPTLFWTFIFLLYVCLDEINGWAQSINVNSSGFLLWINFFSLHTIEETTEQKRQIILLLIWVYEDRIVLMKEVTKSTFRHVRFFWFCSTESVHFSLKWIPCVEFF